MLCNYDITNKLVHGCFQPYHLLQCWLANGTNPYCCAHVRSTPEACSRYSLPQESALTICHIPGAPACQT